MKIYNPPVHLLNGPDAVLAACGHHPLARFGVGLVDNPTGLSEDGTTLFLGRARPDRDTGFVLGPPERLPELMERAAATGLLDTLGWIHLPQGTAVPEGFEVRDSWDFRWASQSPAPQPEQAVVELPGSADDAVNALLDLAMPDSTVRPGDRSASQWYGILEDGVLVACAADRSGRPRSPEPVGVLGGVAVHPEHRGKGYGAAISAAVTGRLFERFDVATLGVWPDNDPAIRIYERLGYTGVWALTSVRRAE